MTLQEYLKSEGWKQLSLHEFRDHLYIVTFAGRDVYGFEEWVIENKAGRKNVIFRGRILGVAHFQAIMTFIKDDFRLTPEEIETLKKYGNKEKDNLQSVTD